MRATHPKRSRRKPRATTTDVLGPDPKPERIKSKWREHYRRLTQLRAALAQRQPVLTKDALEEQPGFSTHMADAGTDMYDRDFALTVLSAEQNAAYEIDEALNRIRNGSYGICEITGKPIEPRRLDAIPWTRFTADVEKQLERDGAVPLTRLGERESVERVSGTAEGQEEEETE